MADRLRLYSDGRSFVRFDDMFYGRWGQMRWKGKKLKRNQAVLTSGMSSGTCQKPRNKLELIKLKRHNNSCRSSSINSRENARNFKGNFPLFSRTAHSLHRKKTLGTGLGLFVYLDIQRDDSPHLSHPRKRQNGAVALRVRTLLEVQMHRCFSRLSHLSFSFDLFSERLLHLFHC